MEFVEAKAKAFPKGPFRRELVTIYRDLKRYDRAEQLLSELHQESPDDTNLAAALIQIVSLRGFGSRRAKSARPRARAQRQGRVDDPRLPGPLSQ